MNTNNDDGGPAFPMPETNNFGISKRDWFAGQALATMTAAPDYSNGPCNNAMAERAYVIADAMLAARKENHEH